MAWLITFISWISQFCAQKLDMSVSSGTTFKELAAQLLMTLSITHFRFHILILSLSASEITAKRVHGKLSTSFSLRRNLILPHEDNMEQTRFTWKNVSFRPNAILSALKTVFACHFRQTFTRSYCFLTSQLFYKPFFL